MGRDTGSITVRRPEFSLADLPHRWVGGSRLGTWFGNAGHVFIPLGEQLFIDSVKAFRDRIDDADLRRDVASFIGQEAVHARVHEAVWDELRSHGAPIDTYADLITRFRAALEPHLPPELLLSTTAALEHYTAAFGRAFLSEDLDGVLPDEMAALLRWHGAEELEHRSVAFDVLAEVDDRLGLRLAGMAMATALLSVVPAVGVGLFAAADLAATRTVGPRWPNPSLVGMSLRFLGDVAGEVVRYLRPGVHPGDQDVPDGYRRWVASPEAQPSAINPATPST